MADDALPEKLTFAEGRDMLADDLHSVAEWFLTAEKQCREGDVHAVVSVIDAMGRWRQILMVRYEDRMSRIEAGREPEAGIACG